MIDNDENGKIHSKLRCRIMKIDNLLVFKRVWKTLIYKFSLKGIVVIL